MIIYNPTLHWTKGEHGYKQGIKGAKNRPHKEGNNYYNGYGGAHMNVDMRLDIIAKDAFGKQISVDVRHYLVEALGKKVMRDELYADLCACLPNQLEIDDCTHRLSEKSLIQIREAYDTYKHHVSDPQRS